MRVGGRAPIARRLGEPSDAAAPPWQTKASRSVPTLWPSIVLAERACIRLVRIRHWTKGPALTQTLLRAALTVNVSGCAAPCVLRARNYGHDVYAGHRVLRAEAHPARQPRRGHGVSLVVRYDEAPQHRCVVILHIEPQVHDHGHGVRGIHHGSGFGASPPLSVPPPRPERARWRAPSCACG